MSDVMFRATLARSLPESDAVTILDGDLTQRRVAVVDQVWDTSTEAVSAAISARGDVGVLVRPLPTGRTEDLALRQVLHAVRRWSSAGLTVATDLDAAVADLDGAVADLDRAVPVPAFVTAAMVAGARVLVLGERSGPQAERDARRAADVTEALLFERAGARPDPPDLPRGGAVGGV
ncbi:MAG: hypothetical protein JST64_11385 [Actinobacteria bacterium]|nr:hypothetical protein [Actinomycetota bacterium]